MIGGKVTVRLNKMPKLEGEMRRRAADEVEEAAEQCAAMARSAAPVLTGDMKASIEVEPESELSRKVVVGEFYGSFVEFGTRKMAARPFLTPAVEATKPPFLTEMKKIAEEAAR